MTSKTLYDAACRTVLLGDEVGHGGEGSVYEVDGSSTLVAKVYHKTPLPEEQIAKLNAMTSCWSASLETIAAWPRSLLFDTVQKQPCGLLMTKMVGAKPLHELYGTTNRRRHFPDVGWHHLVLAARNAASAFHTLHSAGIIVGDVNQGNLLVDKQMCVRMIDCDSFQITREGKTFVCPVGTPHFTPPELQGKKLRDVVRTVNHDRFGLATLIFHLMFVGRHPFAGRFRGTGDLSIEKAIAETRFAFSRNRAATLVDPPPASLLLDDLPMGVANLFEAAFRPTDTNADSRPSAQMWVEQLEALIKRRRACSIDEMHVYLADLDKCPWCRIESVGGAMLFVSSSEASVVIEGRLTRLEVQLAKLQDVLFPELPAVRLALPFMPPLEQAKPLPKLTSLDVAAFLLIAFSVACLLGAFLSRGVFVAGAVGSFAAAGYLLGSKRSRSSRNHVRDIYSSLSKQYKSLQKMARSVELKHRVQKTAFQRSAKELDTEKENYRAEGEQLHDVIAQHRESQKADYLRNHLIRENAGEIRGMTPSRITILESFGIESARDVDRIRLYGVPSIDDQMMIELVQWRDSVERGFVFAPEHGITHANLKAMGEAAVRRFKIAQARKILLGNERLKTLAEEGRSELSRILAPFDEAIKRWKKTADELRDFQLGRRPVERWINQSPMIILGLAVGVAALALLFHLIFG